jgi:hypothetical protein
MYGRPKQVRVLEISRTVPIWTRLVDEYENSIEQLEDCEGAVHFALSYVGMVDEKGQVCFRADR